MIDNRLSKAHQMRLDRVSAGANETVLSIAKLSLTIAMGRNDQEGYKSFSYATIAYIVIPSEGYRYHIKLKAYREYYFYDYFFETFKHQFSSF